MRIASCIDTIISAKITFKKIETQYSKYVLPFSATHKAPAYVRNRPSDITEKPSKNKFRVKR